MHYIYMSFKCLQWWSPEIPSGPDCSFGSSHWGSYICMCPDWLLTQTSLVKGESFLPPDFLLPPETQIPEGWSLVVKAQIKKTFNIPAFSVPLRAVFLFGSMLIFRLVFLFLLMNFMELFLLSFIFFARFNFKRALIFIIASLSNLTTFLYSFQMDSPFFYILWTYFFNWCCCLDIVFVCLGFFVFCFFVFWRIHAHSCRSALWVWFFSHGDELFLSLEEVVVTEGINDAR